jgi:hypothetical protein
MGARWCKVVVGPDVVDGISHAIEVEASSLYEAAVAGLDALQRDSWTPAYVGDVTPITVTVDETGVVHTLRVQSIKAWLARTAGAPHEMLARRQLRDRLAARGLTL